MLSFHHQVKIYSTALLCLVMLLLGCVPENEVTTSVGEEYYPLRVGDYRIYHVSQTNITPYNVEENLTYQTKTLVTDSFQNAGGNFTYVISRYKRASETDAWENLDTWSARMDEKEVIVNEGNVPFVKITFPVKQDRKWNGNAFNNEEPVEFCEGTGFTSCDIYAFGTVHSSFETSGGLNFENTIEVIENDNPNVFTRQDIRKSIYAWDIGLIYREIKVLQYCTNDDCYGLEMVEDGLILTQELTAYGHE